MKKRTLFYTLLFCLALSSCGAKNNNDNPPVVPPEEDEPGEEIKHSWSEADKALFNTYLNDYVLPTLPSATYSCRYFSGEIVIECDYVYNAAANYKESLKTDSFTVIFDNEKNSYLATKSIDETNYISISFCEKISTSSSSFCINASIKEVEHDDPKHEWTKEDIAVFNKYLGGYILPTLPRVMNYKCRPIANDPVIDTEYYEGFAEDYCNCLKADGFTITFDDPYHVGTKYLNEVDYIYVTVYEDLGEEPYSCQICAYKKTAQKEREREWNETELGGFEKYLENVVIPFPDTGHVVMRYADNSTGYFEDNWLWILGDYTDTVLSSYLASLENDLYVLSKHPIHGIDVAKKQLSNNKYIELWVAIADETESSGGKFFEIIGRVRQGTFQVIDSNHIALGSYPQTEVVNNELYNTLYELVGELPEEKKPNGWDIFSDFYVDNKPTDYGFYKDIEYKGEKYRATYSLHPRSIAVHQPLNDEEGGYQCEKNGYFAGNVYFFKFEPIIWEIIRDYVSGVHSLVPCYVLDTQYFSTEMEPIEVDGKTIYPSNYEHSFVRSWLNNEFYNTAFNAEEQEQIQKTVYVNSIEENYPTDSDYSTAEILPEGMTWEDLISEDTRDFVSLLSRKDLVENSHFGYDDIQNWQNIDSDKAAKPGTDYAFSRGALRNSAQKGTVYENEVCFFLRTALICSYFGTHIHLSDAYCGLAYAYSFSYLEHGVFPLINVKF